MVSNPLGTCTLCLWTLMGSIIIIKQPQPGTTTVPILHGYSRSRHQPVMAYLRYGAMRSCFTRPMKSSYSIVCICQEVSCLWTQLNYKIMFWKIVDYLFRDTYHGISEYCGLIFQKEKAAHKLPHCHTRYIPHFLPSEAILLFAFVCNFSQTMQILNHN